MNWSEEYKKSLKMREVEEIFDLYIYRPLAFLIVRAVYKTKITPNNITFIAILMGLTAGYFYSLGKPVYFKAGALFYLAFNILDCSDGQLARLKKNGNHIGRLIDGIGDYIATLAVYIGIAFGFVSKAAHPYYWLTLLLLAGGSTMIHGMLVDYYRNRFLNFVNGRKSNSEKDFEECKKEFESIKNKKGKIFDRMVFQIYFKYTELQRFIIARKKKPKLFITTSQEYYQKNKIILRYWVILGPTTQVTALIICSFLNRLDIFIWIIIAVFNCLAAILWLFQAIIDKTLKKEN
jgi:phosphatidylglycerophosphate synthase